MKLISIPKEKYNDYRLDLMFNCYKWDPQFVDNNTIAKNVLVITKEEHEELKKLTEMLDKETRQAEEVLNSNLKLSKPLALPKKIYRELKNTNNYEPDRHIRLMRYDFHLTEENACEDLNESDIQEITNNLFCINHNIARTFYKVSELSTKDLQMTVWFQKYIIEDDILYKEEIS